MTGQLAAGFQSLNGLADLGPMSAVHAHAALPLRLFAVARGAMRLFLLRASLPNVYFPG